MRHLPFLAMLAATLLAPPAAAAYVGPGAGLSLIGSVVALLAAIGTAVGFVLFWPVRALYRRLRGRRGAAAPATDAPTDQAPARDRDARP